MAGICYARMDIHDCAFLSYVHGRLTIQRISTSTQSGHCPVCEAPKALFGSAASSPAPRRNFADYFLKLITATDTDVARSTRDAAGQYLDNRGVRQTEGVFWALKSLDWVSLLVPDVLHTICLSILKHLINWVIPFLEHHNRMDR